MTGLALPDNRTPWAFWDFTVGIVALPLLVVMIVIGVIRTLIRRRRRRRSLRAAVPVPSL